MCAQTLYYRQFVENCIVDEIKTSLGCVCVCSFHCAVITRAIVVG